jgi:ATP-dependent DNA helicase DinG
VAIHNHPSGVLLPSDADLGVASALGNRGVGFAIISNDATRANVVVPLLPKKERRAIGADEVAGILGPGGKLAARLRGYETRPQQLAMAAAVARAFTDGEVALLEAGTGTGKSFAYLVPAVLHAKANGEKVVVSTGTINLQEQLVTKDVPALQGVLPPFQAVVVKGRSNYVSLRRAAEAARGDAGLYESESERAEVARLAEWAVATKTGDRQELVPAPSPDAWEKVESQSDNCLGVRCATYAECHYMNSRRAAARADVLVANHALLVTDLAAKREIGNFAVAAVLPPYERVIVDEAHHLEEVAAEHLGAHTSALGVARLLGRLRHRRDAGRGLLPVLRQALLRASRSGGLDDAPAVERALRAVDETLLPARDRAVQLADSSFHAIAFRVRQRAGAGEGERREIKLRLRPDAASREVISELEPLREALAILQAELARALDPLENALGKARPGCEGVLLETLACAHRLGQRVDAIARTQALEDATHVRWIEVKRDRRGEDRCELHAAPLDTAPVLREALLEKAKTVVFSSATLAVRGDFGYVARGLGALELPEARVATLALESPFDFAEQAVLGIPLDLPEPSSPRFDDACASLVLDAVRLTRGRAFVLFTSFRSLDRVHRTLAPVLRAEGFLPLAQGETGRRALLEKFKSSAAAVLFGTDSFWEGVDVPGDGLVLVVLTKLPFKVPSEPFEEARAEAIRARGGDPFRDLMLPRAVLKLKQGFGRLIRTRTDHGAVLVLDPRIVRRSYGRAFVESLPRVPVVRGPWAQVREAVARTTVGAP